MLSVGSVIIGSVGRWVDGRLVGGPVGGGSVVSGFNNTRLALLICSVVSFSS